MKQTHIIYNTIQTGCFSEFRMMITLLHIKVLNTINNLHHGKIISTTVNRSKTKITEKSSVSAVSSE